MADDPQPDDAQEVAPTSAPEPSPARRRVTPKPVVSATQRPHHRTPGRPAAATPEAVNPGNESGTTPNPSVSPANNPDDPSNAVVVVRDEAPTAKAWRSAVRRIRAITAQRDPNQAAEPTGTVPGKPAYDSMHLFSDIVEGALDPGYRAMQDAPQRSTTAVTTTVVLIAIGGGILLGAALIGLRTPNVAESTRQDIRADIRQREAHNQSTAERNEVLKEENAALQRSALPNGAAHKAIDHLEHQAGYVAERGSGIRLTITDPQRSAIPNVKGPTRLIDTDLQTIVNALWLAGATAIDVNGNRLTNTSAVRSAGGAILVNFSPTTGPYQVTALGEAEMLRDRFAKVLGSYLDTLQKKYGIVTTIETGRDFESPAAPGAQLLYAKPIQSAAVDDDADGGSAEATAGKTGATDGGATAPGGAADVTKQPAGGAS